MPFGEIHCCGPKPLPVIVMVPPAGASGGEMVVIAGCGTSNWTVWLGTAFTVTSSGPEEAPLGTLATICVSLQLVTEAGTPLKVMVLSRWVVWNPLPEIVIAVPPIPPEGDVALILGGGTVNKAVLLFTPPTLTTAGPEAAVTGTVPIICVFVQLETDA